MRGFDRFANPRHFMGFEVIHNHNIARTEVRNKDLADVAAEDLAVGTTIHGHRRHEALHAHCADQCHGLTAIARFSGIRTLTARRPGIRARHVDVAAGLIDKDQLLHRLLLAPLLEGGPSLAARLGILLGSMERLFFRVSPSWSSARYMVERPTWTRTFVANCSQRSASDASGCW